MAVKIRLKRLGSIRNAQYRVVVMDSRTKRDGRAIEEIGTYHPKREPSLIDIDGERAQYWLGVGAQPTEQVQQLLKVTGDWQKFKGESGAEGSLQAQPQAKDKKALYEAALAAAQNASEDAGKGAATTARKKADKSADAPRSTQATVGDEPAVAQDPVQADQATTAQPAAGAADVEGASGIEGTGSTAAGTDAPASPTEG